MRHLPVIAILLLALVLRLAGIGHGLDSGDIPHPDTPKQVNAVASHIAGRPYSHIGLSDYDGYPLFASYLTALAVKAGAAVVRPVQTLVGVEPGPRTPEKMTLFWLMRLMNVALAVLVVWVVWRAGTENFGRGAGLLAALLLAVSPADVAACHYASGDTAAAVFGLISVFFALRIHRRGAWADYVFAGVFAACAFASKYHALVVCGAAGLAHILRAENYLRWHRAASLTRLAVLGAAFVAGLFFAIPGLREQPVLVVKDILHFMGYAADFGLPPELVGASFTTKLKYSLARNLPILGALFSLPVVVALACLVLRPVRDVRAVLLLAAPLLYFIMGVSQRPFAHPVYHTIMTASVYLLASLAVVRMWGAEGRARGLLRALAGAIVLTSIPLLAHGSLREAYFFRRDDTRIFSRAWASENIPATYAFYPTRYTFRSELFTGTEQTNSGAFMFSPDIRPVKNTNGFERWFTFGVERDALPFFRNPSMTVWLSGNSILKPGHISPVLQRQPSYASTDYIIAGLPEFFRSGRILNVPVRRSLSRSIVSQEPLRDVLLCASADSANVRLEVRFGGVKKIIRLKPRESTAILIEAPRAGLPFGTGFQHYPLQLTADHGGARVSLAFTDRERAVDLFQCGLHAQALPYLEKISSGGQPALFVAMRASAQMSKDASAKPQELNTDLADLTDAMLADVRTRFENEHGINAAYLEALPARHWDAAAMTSRGFDLNDLPAMPGSTDTEISLVAERRGTLSVNGLWLEPGVYSLSLHLRAPAQPVTGTLTYSFDDGGTRFTRAFPLRLEAGAAFTAITTRIALPQLFRSGRIEIHLPENSALAVDGFDIRPDPVATAAVLLRSSR